MNKLSIKKIVVANVNGRSSITTYKHLEKEGKGFGHTQLDHGNWSKGAGMYGGKGAGSNLAKKVGERLRAEVGFKPIGTRGKPEQRKGIRPNNPKPTLEQATARLGERSQLRKGQRIKRRDALDERTILREREEMRQRIANQGKFGNRGEKPYSGPEHSWVRYGGNPKANYKPTEKDRAFAAKWKYDMYEREAMDMLSPKWLSLARRQIKNNQIFGKSSTTDEILATGPRGKSTDTPMVTGQKRGTWVRNMVRRLWDRDDAREDRVMDADPFFGKRADVEKYIPSETLTRMEYQSTKESSTKEIKGIVTANVNKRVKSSSYKALANIMVSLKHLEKEGKGFGHTQLDHGNWSKGAGMYGGAAGGTLAKKVADRLRNATFRDEKGEAKQKLLSKKFTRAELEQAKKDYIAMRFRLEVKRVIDGRWEVPYRNPKHPINSLDPKIRKQAQDERSAAMRQEENGGLDAKQMKARAAEIATAKQNFLNDVAVGKIKLTRTPIGGYIHTTWGHSVTPVRTVTPIMPVRNDTPVTPIMPVTKKEIKGIVTANVNKRVKSSSYKASANIMVSLKHLEKEGKGFGHTQLDHGNWSKGAGMYGGALAKKVGDRLRNALGAGKIAFGKLAGAAGRVVRGATSSARAAVRAERTTRAARAARAAQTVQGVKDKVTELGATMRGKKVPPVKAGEAKAPQSQSRLDKLRDLAKGVAQGVKDKIAGAKGAVARAARLAKDLPSEIGATMRGKKVPPVKPGEAKAPQSQSRLDKLRDLAKGVAQGVKDKIAGAKGAVARAVRLAKDLPSEIGATMRGKKVPPVKPGEAKAPQSQSRLAKLRDLAKGVAQGVKDKVTELGATMRGKKVPTDAKKITAEANKKIDVARDTANNGGIPSSAITRGMNRPQLRPGGMQRPQLRPGGMQRPQLRPTKKPLAPNKTPKTIDEDWYNVAPTNNKKPNANGLGTKRNPSEAIKQFLRAALIIGGVTLAAGGVGAVGGAVGAVGSAVGAVGGAVGDLLGIGPEAEAERKRKAATVTKEIRNIVARNIAHSLRSST